MNLNKNERFDTASISLDQLGRFLTQISEESLFIVEVQGDPFYSPDPPTLHFVQGSIPSLLHEFSHWLIAGRERRQLPDYGYWYAPEGRHLGEQKKFEQVEAYPQAVEWLLSVAIGRTFVASFDNFSLKPEERMIFATSIGARLRKLLCDGISPRIEKHLLPLSDFCRTRTELDVFMAKARDEILIPFH